MSESEIAALHETTATLLAHAESTHMLLTEMRDEVRKQGTTIIEIRLGQAKVEQRLEHGSKEMQIIRDERAACEARCKEGVNRAAIEGARELAEVKADALRELEEVRNDAAKDLVALQNGTVKKTDILSGLWQMFLASGLSAALVAGLVAAYLKMKGC